jgi:hypothetical protein
VAPADLQVARIVVGADGFVVKGPRVLGAKQTTTLVVDDRDAPFKLKLRLRADGASARVAVESDPWGIVRVDQVGRGKTPVADVVVPFGKKTLLSLQAPGGRAMDVTLTLTAAP